MRQLYLLQCCNEDEPRLLGPFDSEEERDDEARGCFGDWDVVLELYVEDGIPHLVCYYDFDNDEDQETHAEAPDLTGDRDAAPGRRPGDPVPPPGADGIAAVETPAESACGGEEGRIGPPAGGLDDHGGSVGRVSHPDDVAFGDRDTCIRPREDDDGECETYEGARAAAVEDPDEVSSSCRETLDRIEEAGGFEEYRGCPSPGPADVEPLGDRHEFAEAEPAPHREEVDSPAGRRS